MSHDWGSALTLSYAWIKAAHVIFVIFWISSLFMLPRFYVYHQESPPGSDEEKKWIERETKLRTIIMTPSMLLVWVLGLTLAWITGAWSEGWSACWWPSAAENSRRSARRRCSASDRSCPLA